MIPEIILDAYEQGTLCNCKNWKGIYNPKLNRTDYYLYHDKACDGVTKLSILLESPYEIRPQQSSY